MPSFSEQKTTVQTEYQLKHNSYRALKVFCSFTKRCDFYHDDHAWRHVPVCRETLSWSHVSWVIASPKDPCQPHQLSQKCIQRQLPSQSGQITTQVDLDVSSPMNWIFASSGWSGCLVLSSIPRWFCRVWGLIWDCKGIGMYSFSSSLCQKVESNSPPAQPKSKDKPGGVRERRGCGNNFQ